MRKLVHHRGILGEPNRVIHRYLVHHRPEAQVGRLPRERGQVDVRRRDAGEERVLVLDEEVVAVAVSLRILGVGDVLLVNLGIQGPIGTGLKAIHDAEG